MRRVGHDQLNPHQAHHKYFIDAVGDLRRKHQNGAGSVSVEVIDFLTHWLIDHIMGWDRRYIGDDQSE
jgi:hemerythrin